MTAEVAMKPILVHEQLVRATDLPVPPSNPVPVYIGWRWHEAEGKWEAWWYGPWWHPFGENLSGLPGGYLDSAMPGTVIIPRHVARLVVNDKDDVFADSELCGPVVKLRLWVRRRADGG